MSLYQLSRHLDGKPDLAQPDSVLLTNLLRGTRLLVAKDEAWPLLERYRQPSQLGQGELEARAAQAGVLQSSEPQETSSELSRLFDEVSAKVLSYRKVEPSECLFTRVRQLAEACQPITVQQTADYFIWQNPRRVFEILLDHFHIYLATELGTGAGCDMPAELVRQSLGRPPVEQTLEQQVSTLSTAWARACRIAERFPTGGKVLILGDDDLVSLALAHFPQFEIEVLEIDLQLVRLLKKESGGRFSVKRRDLSGGLPAEYHGHYDVVVSDPMYSAAGMEMFVDCCAPALKAAPESRLFLSTYPPLLEAPDRLWQVLDSAGLAVHLSEEHFNRYPFPAENRRSSQEGLVALGYHPKLVSVLTSVPYLYAHLYECGLKEPV